MNINKSFINTLSFTGKGNDLFRRCHQRLRRPRLQIVRELYSDVSQRLRAAEETDHLQNNADDADRSVGRSQAAFGFGRSRQRPGTGKTGTPQRIDDRRTRFSSLCGVCSITPVLWDWWTSIRSRSCFFK